MNFTRRQFWCASTSFRMNVLTVCASGTAALRQLWEEATATPRPPTTTCGTTPSMTSIGATSADAFWEASSIRDSFARVRFLWPLDVALFFISFIIYLFIFCLQLQFFSYITRRVKNLLQFIDIEGNKSIHVLFLNFRLWFNRPPHVCCHGATSLCKTILQVLPAYLALLRVWVESLHPV